MTQVTKKRAAALGLAALIAIPAEGLRQKAYYDPPGILTVCYGSTSNVVPGRVYSLKECGDRLNADMAAAVAQVDRRYPNAPVNVLAAFSDAVYNIGPAIVIPSSSTAGKFLKAGKWREACNQLPRWNKARIAGVPVALPGLTKRRERERQLCLDGLPVVQ